MNEFDDIRPFNNEEVETVMHDLLDEKEFFHALSKIQFPRFTKSFPNTATAITTKYLRKKILQIKTIEQVQDIVRVQMDKLFKRTTDGVTQDGLSNLGNEESYLFISNHRDIVMDPSLVGYFLLKSNHKTCEIAIGDNLLKKKYISDLMRLNKCFIVNRSAVGREKLFALKKLSAYIHYALENKNNIWIAQSEGRAKDGIDITDPAIIKMFHMGRKSEDKKLNIKEDLSRLNIVPVSISYEYDPCDLLKAIELHAIATTGDFVKNETTDEKSISTGINGYKGRVHIQFGDIIDIKEENAPHIAQLIDEQIINSYRLYPSNFLAYSILQKNNPEIGPKLEEIKNNPEITEEQRSFFNDRYNSFPEHLKPFFLEMYGNPVISMLQLNPEP